VIFGEFFTKTEAAELLLESTESEDSSETIKAYERMIEIATETVKETYKLFTIGQCSKPHLLQIVSSQVTRQLPTRIDL
jgi:hypothetical protein